MKTAVFWYVISRSWVGRQVGTSILKMEAANSSETFVPFYQTNRSQNSSDMNHIHSRQNFRDSKCHILITSDILPQYFIYDASITVTTPVHIG